MGPTWGPTGTDRTQVGPMLAPWTLLSGTVYQTVHENVVVFQNISGDVEANYVHWQTGIELQKKNIQDEFNLEWEMILTLAVICFGDTKHKHISELDKVSNGIKRLSCDYDGLQSQDGVI